MAEVDAAGCIDALIDARVLVEGGSSEAFDTARGDWERFGWAGPLAFHGYTNELPKLDYSRQEDLEADGALMREYIAAEQPPPSYKVVESREKIFLRKELSTLSISRAWGATGGNSSLDLEQLGGFCHYAFGQIGTKRLSVTGTHVRKSVPSGGARHPTEVYVVLLGPNWQAQLGIYHYDVRHHALALVASGDHIQFCREHVFLDPSLSSSAPTVVFILTTVFERSMYRYRESRSYRVVHHDVGHVIENASLLASSLGLRFRRGYSMHDSRVEERLGLADFEESAMAYLAIG